MCVLCVWGQMVVSELCWKMEVMKKLRYEGAGVERGGEGKRENERKRERPRERLKERKKEKK